MTNLCAYLYALTLLTHGVDNNNIPTDLIENKVARTATQRAKYITGYNDIAVENFEQQLEQNMQELCKKESNEILTSIEKSINFLMGDENSEHSTVTYDQDIERYIKILKTRHHNHGEKAGVLNYERRQNYKSPYNPHYFKHQDSPIVQKMSICYDDYKSGTFQSDLERNLQRFDTAASRAYKKSCYQKEKNDLEKRLSEIEHEMKKIINI